MSENDIPKGTWSSGEMPAVRPPAEVVPMRPADAPEARHDSQVTPLPTSPLALASEDPVLRADATGSRPRPPKRGADVVPIRPEAEQKDPPAEEASTETSPAEPPFLASRSLAEELTPREPDRRTLRILGTVSGAAGGAAALLLGGTSTSSVAAAVGLFVIAALSALPLRYELRALVVSGLTATCLGFFSAGLHLRGARLDESLLAGAAFVLGAGLLLRSYHRASRLARVVVLAGVAALGAYLVLSGGLSALTRMDAAWQSWGPAIPRVAFGLLGLLSFLAFMDASTTAGGRFWAVLLFVAYAGHVATTNAARVWPVTAMGHPLSVPNPALGQAVAMVVVVVVGSVALAQLLAAAAARRISAKRAAR